MTEQCELVVRHGLLFRTDEATGHGQAVALSQFVQPAPAIDGQELMVWRRADGTTKLSRQPKDRLAAGGKGLFNRASLHRPGVGIQGHDAEPALPNELSNWPVDSQIR